MQGWLTQRSPAAGQTEDRYFAREPRITMDMVMEERLPWNCMI
jgi:hypothetical protein